MPAIRTRPGGPRPVFPVNSAVPTISGTAQTGQTLTASPGTWAGYPAVSFTYQWIRGASTVIVGATASTYVPQVADEGSTLKVQVTGSSQLGSTVATSANTAAVIAA